MANLGSLFYTLGIKDMTDADLQRIEQKLAKLGVKIDAGTIRQQIEGAISTTPFNASVNFVNARASLDAVLAGTKGQVTVEVIASRLKESINKVLTANKSEVLVKPKRKELIDAVRNALLSVGFEVRIGKVGGLALAVNKAMGKGYDIELKVDPAKLATSIDKSLSRVRGRAVSVEVKKKILTDSVRNALQNEKFPIKVVVNKAETQDAVRQALQAAGIQGRGYTASDKRASDAQARMMEAQARAAAANALAQRRLASAHNTAQRAASSNTSENITLGSAMRGNIRIAGELGSAIAGAYSVVVLKNFIQRVIDIGGELEQQKVAMNAILGDGGMANTITSQIKSLAVKSPFGIMDLTQYAKQLIAFQIPYNELYDTMKRLADISAAVGVDMGRIILAYGQVRAAKFLKGTELRQFTEANIPLIDMLAKRFTKLKGEIVSAGDIMEMVSNKEISFEDVKAILWELTGEGGKFHNMQEVLSDTVKAKWKNLADAIDVMFGSIAESTSSPLKYLAEILTELTSNWNTIAAAAAGGAAAFGLVKVASLLTARSLDASGASALSAAAKSALLERQNLKLARGYRVLTATEQQALGKSMPMVTGWWNKQRAMLNSLSAAQFKQLVLTKQITKEEWMRMVALNRLSYVQKSILVQTGALTKAELAQITVLPRWRMAVLGLGNAFRSLGRSMLALVANPVGILMAAIAAIAALWQRNNEEMERAKGIGDNLTTKFKEGAGNLRQTLEDINPSSELSYQELMQGIEQMQQAIKDYSPTPIKDINDALVDQNGHVRSLTEQYDFLRQKVEGLGDAYDKSAQKQAGDMAKRAIEATDEGLFNDDLISNAIDYDNALKRREAGVVRFVKNYNNYMGIAVSAAEKADKKFAAFTKGMQSLEEKLRSLAENTDRFKIAATNFDMSLHSKGAGPDSFIRIWGNNAQVSAAKKELESDNRKFMDNLNIQLKAQGLFMADLTEEQMRNLTEEQRKIAESHKAQLVLILRATLDAMEDAGEASKAVLAKQWEDEYHVTVMEDKIGPVIQEALRKSMLEGGNQGLFAIAKNIELYGYDSLDKASKDTVYKLTRAAKLIAMKELRLTEEEMSDYLQSHPLKQIITLAFQTAPVTDLYRELYSRIATNVDATMDRYFKEWTSSGTASGLLQAAKAAKARAANELAAAKKINQGVENAQNEYNAVTRLINALGLDLSSAGETGGKRGGGSRRSGGSEKDTIAEKFRREFKDIKDAWSEFQKWQKVIGTEAAAKKVVESGLFPFITQDNIPKTAEEFEALLENLRKRLEAVGIKGHKERETLLNEIIKQMFDVEKSRIDEQIKFTLDTVSKEVERQLSNWDLYEKVRKATGNRQFAQSIAFGLDPNAETNYPELIEQQFNKQADNYEKTVAKKIKDYEPKGYTYQSLETLYKTAVAEGATKNDIAAWMAVPEDLRKAWGDANNNIIKYFTQQKEAITDILSEYQSLQEKLEKIDADRQDKIDIVNKSDLSEPDKAALIQRINVEADYQKFTQSAEYLQFFSGIYSLTMQQAQQIGAAIRLHLDKRLQAGKISAEEYYKEIERINQQLSKLRNVKSDAMTFMTGGFQGLWQKQLDQANSAVLRQMTKVQEVEEKLAKAKASGNAKAVASADTELNAAKRQLETQEKIRDELGINIQQLDMILAVAKIADGIAKGLSNTFNSIKDTADALGVDTESGAWLDVGGVLDTLSAMTSGMSQIAESLKSGDLSGGVSGIIGMITQPFAIWARIHDKKLQKMIERSKHAAQIMQNQYDILEQRMANFLGNAANMEIDGYNGDGGAYGKQRELMQGQLKELEKQRQAEIAKKKTDNAAVADYSKQIEEMEIKIREFALETAKNLYDIDLKDWAQQLGDTLYDAWKKGEDGAEAFRRKAGEIIGDVMNNILRLQLLEPMMQDVSDYLFGKDGMSGAFGRDFELTPNEVENLAGMITKGLAGVDAYNAALDRLEKVLNEKGLSMKDTESKSGATAGLQSLTEDTGNLLASYINSIRADVSANRLNWSRLLDTDIPQMNVIAEAQLQAQRHIAENTLRNAIAAESILTKADDINRLLYRVTLGTSRFYIH